MASWYKARAVKPASASRNEASASRDAGSMASRCSVSFPQGTRVTCDERTEEPGVARMSRP